LFTFFSVNLNPDSIIKYAVNQSAEGVCCHSGRRDQVEVFLVRCKETVIVGSLRNVAYRSPCCNYVCVFRL